MTRLEREILKELTVSRKAGYPYQRLMTSSRTKAAHKARMETILKKNSAIVARGVCPDCGTELRRNSALTGWWQCDCYGLDQFRKPENRGKPSCSFQCFID